MSLILDLLASGLTTTEILQEYPDQEEADILACIAMAPKWPGSVEVGRHLFP